MSASEQCQPVQQGRSSLLLSLFGGWGKSGESLSRKDSDLSLVDVRASSLLYI